MKTIALDIGNVCIGIHPENCLSSLGFSEDTEIPDSLIKSINEMETGLICETEWLKTFHRLTDNKFSDDELRNAYCSILGKEKSEVIRFIEKAVSYGFRIIFFSDTSPIHINQVLRNLSFANLISGGIYSFKVGSRKPDIKIYRKFEEIYGTPMLYIDDKKENIESGEKIGWNSIIFESENSIQQAYKIFN